MAIFCQNCNKELSARAKFCRMCGTPAAPLLAAPAPMPASEAVPPTEVLSPPAARSVSGGTAPTEPALLARWQAEREQRQHGQIGQIGRNGNHGERDEELKSRPLAPATHAIFGIFEQAGFSLRLAAFMLDFLLLMLLLLASAIAASSLPQYSTIIQQGGFIVAFAGWLLNFIIMAGYTGQTLGKRLVGIRIIAVDQRRAAIKQIIIRHLLGYPISLVVLAAGFFWLLWDRQQQGWHDKLAGTIVIRKRLNW